MALEGVDGTPPPLLLCGQAGWHRSQSESRFVPSTSTHHLSARALQRSKFPTQSPRLPRWPRCSPCVKPVKGVRWFERTAARERRVLHPSFPPHASAISLSKRNKRTRLARTHTDSCCALSPNDDEDGEPFSRDHNRWRHRISHYTAKISQMCYVL